MSAAGAVPAAGPKRMDVDTATRLVDRWPSMRSFVLVGIACITGGGMVAAVTRPAGLELGSWLAAFLVLVGGVAQIALGAGQAWLCDDRPPSQRLAGQVLTWNLGLAATITGSLLHLPALTSAGGLATGVALVLFLTAVRTSSSGPTWLRVSYRAVVVVVLASTPIGLALAWLRHS